MEYWLNALLRISPSSELPLVGALIFCYNILIKGEIGNR